jgi:hypothetical protein
MPQKKYLVTLNDEEREQLEQLLHSGTHATRTVTCARMLLKAAEGWEDGCVPLQSIGGIGTEMTRGVDVTAASCRSNSREGGTRGLQPGSLARLLTSGATGLTGEPQKRLRLVGGLAQGHQRLRWHWASCSRLRWPQPIEHQEHPHQDDQPKLVENEMGYHGIAPSHRW